MTKKSLKLLTKAFDDAEKTPCKHFWSIGNTGTQECLWCFKKRATPKNPAAVALGKIKSAKKAKSSVVNGALGGRPKKTKRSARRPNVLPEPSRQ